MIDPSIKKSSGTYIILRHGIFIAVFRFALWQFSEVLRRPDVQLLLDLAILSTKRQVVWCEPPVGQAVDISSQSNQLIHKCEVLEVHSEMECRSATALFLKEKKTYSLLVPQSKPVWINGKSIWKSLKTKYTSFHLLWSLHLPLTELGLQPLRGNRGSRPSGGSCVLSKRLRILGSEHF